MLSSTKVLKWLLDTNESTMSDALDNQPDPLIEFLEETVITERLDLEAMKGIAEAAETAARASSETPKADASAARKYVPPHKAKAATVTPKPVLQQTKITEKQQRNPSAGSSIPAVAKGKQKQEASSSMLKEEVEKIAETTFDADMYGDDLPSEYQESYASLADLGEVRAETEAIKTQLAEVRQTVEALLAERTAIPQHLDRIQARFTRDMTLLLERIEDGKREGASTAGPSASVGTRIAHAAAVVIGEETKEEVTAMKSLLHTAPDTTGPLVSTSVTLAGKRRFKTVK
jgi:hypothetical protein